MRSHVDSAGQMTIPKPIRDRLGVGTGGDVEFKVGADGRTYIESVEPTSSIPDRWERVRGTATSGLSTDEIMALTRGEE